MSWCTAVPLVALAFVGCAPAAASPEPTHVDARPTPIAEPSRPRVGAIRWDAWFGDDPSSDVGRQVERSLGPQRWHYRLPFFAEELSDTEVRVRENTPAVMDQEIECARAAGIDYWAFVMYAADAPMTRGGVELFLQRVHPGALHFAMIAQSYTFADADRARLVAYFGRQEYQRVAGGRPLLFLLGPTRVDDAAWPDVAQSVKALRRASVAAGRNDPYIVGLWGWDHAKAIADAAGLDAVSAYSLQFDGKAAPFSELARETEQKWDEWRAAGAAVVPLVMTGWDRRPRVEHPVSWEAPDGKPDAMGRYYAAPTPRELAVHVDAAVRWCGSHRDAAIANAILIYAWNEFDEGGWLVPSLSSAQGNARLDAIHDVLIKPRPRGVRLRL
jgi:hypothetical protein